MPAPTKGPRLGGSPAHQKAILSNLATNLFEHGAITTTEAKARRLRPFAEKLISKAKRGDLHNRRQVLSVVRDKTVVHLLFTEIGPRYADRPGGYTRITKLGPRKGDNAPMAVIELVEADFTPKTRTTKKAAASKATSPAPVASEAPEATAEATATDDVATETPDVSTDDGAEVEATDELSRPTPRTRSPPTRAKRPTYRRPRSLLTPPMTRPKRPPTRTAMTRRSSPAPSPSG